MSRCTETNGRGHEIRYVAVCFGVTLPNGDHVYADDCLETHLTIRTVRAGEDPGPIPIPPGWRTPELCGRCDATQREERTMDNYDLTCELARDVVRALGYTGGETLPAELLASVHTWLAESADLEETLRMSPEELAAEWRATHPEDE